MKNKINRWSLFDLFAPACAACGLGHAGGVGRLCAGCTADLPLLQEVPAPSRRRRANDDALAPDPGRERSVGAPAVPATVIAACAYAFPVDRLVQQLKFGGRLPLARPLGHLLADAVLEQGRQVVERSRLKPLPRETVGREMLPQVLVPVPLHPARERQRGFNQAEAIARVVGRELGIPVAARAVARQRDTSAQSGLGLDQRRRNLRHAFILRGVLPPHVALVDDVMTTGSTLAAVAEVLRAGGVRHIEAWVVAKTL